MAEGSQDSPWETVQALEAFSKSLTRASASLQASRLSPATKDQALAVEMECKAVISRLLEHHSSAQPESDPTDDAEGLGKAVEELLDDVLERVDTSLDRARALLKAAKASAASDKSCSHSEAGPASAAQPVAGVRASGKAGKAAFLAQHMDFSTGPRPQDTFIPPIDNSNEHFMPQLQAWQQALPDCPGLESNDPPGIHPLQEKLANLVYQPWQLTLSEPIMPQGLDETPLTYVDTLPALEALASELALASEVAVDLEAHSYRSFQGFCCLMQISTRQADYLVDAIRLRSAIGPCLGPFFADAKVVKVLHGADSDIVWLQRDFGIYVVNMFDTGQAARVLAFPSAGLAYLLSHLCGVKADKRWQMADWRVRPLSDEALLYARMDTHFLLYMYDRIKVELADVPRVPDHFQCDLPASGPATMMSVVLERSRRLCLQQYQKELFTPTSYLDAYARMQDRLTRQQLSVYAGLYAWRDRIARDRDESTGFVMPKLLLMKLVKGIPKTTQELLKHLGNTGKRSSPIVVEQAPEVLQVITTAAQNPESVPEPDQAPRPTRQHHSQAAYTASAPSQSNTAQAPGTEEPQPVAAQQHIASSNVATAEAQTATTHLGGSQEHAAPQQNAPRPGSHQKKCTEGGLSAAEARPRVIGLQPKAIPSLCMGAQKASGLFRQPPRPSLAASLPPVPASATLDPGQLGPLSLPGATATPDAAATGRPMPEAAATAVPATAAAAGTCASEAAASSAAGDAGKIAAAGCGNAGASGLAESIITDASEATAVQLSLQGDSAAPKMQRPPMQSQATKLGSMFGAPKRARSGQSAALLSTLSHSQKLISTAEKAAAIDQLKAQLALPFASSISIAGQLPDAPSQLTAHTAGISRGLADAATGVSTHEGDGEAPMQRTSGAAVRSVMEGFQSENRFEILNTAPKGRQSEPEDAHSPEELLALHFLWADDASDPAEFLPLPISEEYQLPSKRRRRSEQPSNTHSERPETPPDRDMAEFMAAEQAALTETGLDSDSNARDEIFHDSQAQKQARDTGQSSKNQHRQSSKAHLLLQYDAAGGGSAEPRPLGPVFPRKHKPMKSKKQSKPADSHPAQHRGKVHPAVKAYDYAAAKAAATGLDVSAIVGLHPRRKAQQKKTSAQGSRGSDHAEKDGPGSDRLSLGGAAEGNSKKHRKQKAFDPYSSFEANEIKGGKHSSAMHKMGNRSMTFG